MSTVDTTFSQTIQPDQERYWNISNNPHMNGWHTHVYVVAVDE